jgi:hypothetical protein
VVDGVTVATVTVVVYVTVSVTDASGVRTEVVVVEVEVVNTVVDGAANVVVVVVLAVLEMVISANLSTTPTQSTSLGMTSIWVRSKKIAPRESFCDRESVRRACDVGEPPSSCRLRCGKSASKPGRLSSTGEKPAEAAPVVVQEIVDVLVVEVVELAVSVILGAVAVIVTSIVDVLV